MSFSSPSSSIKNTSNDTRMPKLDPKPASAEEIALFACAAAQLDVAMKAMTEAYSMLLRIDRQQLTTRTLKARVKEVRFYAREIAAMGVDDILRATESMSQIVPGDEAIRRPKEKKRLEKQTDLSEKDKELLWAATSKATGTLIPLSTFVSGQSLLSQALTADQIASANEPFSDDEKKALFKELSPQLSQHGMGLEEFCRKLDKQTPLLMWIAKTRVERLRRDGKVGGDAVGSVKDGVDGEKVPEHTAEDAGEDDGPVNDE